VSNISDTGSNSIETANDTVKQLWLSGDTLQSDHYCIGVNQ